MMTILCMTNLGTNLLELGKFEEAVLVLKRAVEIREENDDRESPEALMARNSLAAAYTNLGKPHEAEMLFREIEEIQRRTLGEDHPERLHSLCGLAFVLDRQNKTDEAGTVLADAVKRAQRSLPKENRTRNMLHQNYGIMLVKAKAYPEAEIHIRAWYEGAKAGLGADSNEARIALKNLKSLYKRWGRPERIEDLLDFEGVQEKD
jgi:tetratricopeptide (TPR) repeat protein